MRYLFQDLLLTTASQMPEQEALRYKGSGISYQQLAEISRHAARGFTDTGLSQGARIAVYLPKQFETVASFFASTMAGGVFVPINPVLKPKQVGHIIDDCQAEVLVTSRTRAIQLSDVLQQNRWLRWLVITDLQTDEEIIINNCQQLSWEQITRDKTPPPQPLNRSETQMAAILYTSGSTGKPKGVMLSHRNLIAGAESVSTYIGNRPDDRILALLPLSFDAGLSQITTAFVSGATCILLDYLLPNDVAKIVKQEAITGITAVPPLWHQLAGLDWNQGDSSTLRYIANTGGHMSRALLEQLRNAFPNARPYLMYGLTEAFRSTYLDPEQLDRRPDSIGKAIPNAEVLVLREDGSECLAGEVGELVHAGPLVSLGYWNDQERSSERFKPLPQRPGQIFEERAVWSGDRVKSDEEGYLYFVGRADEMIKTSGYRVSPSEIEELAYSSGLIKDAVALGRPHPTLGQVIIVIVSSQEDPATCKAELMQQYRQQLPNFMVPTEIFIESSALPRTPNGKFDRNLLKQRYATLPR